MVQYSDTHGKELHRYYDMFKQNIDIRGGRLGHLRKICKDFLDQYDILDIIEIKHKNGSIEYGLIYVYVRPRDRMETPCDQFKEGLFNWYIRYMTINDLSINLLKNEHFFN